MQDELGGDHNQFETARNDKYDAYFRQASHSELGCVEWRAGPPARAARPLRDFEHRPAPAHFCVCVCVSAAFFEQNA